MRAQRDIIRLRSIRASPPRTIRPEVTSQNRLPRRRGARLLISLRPVDSVLDSPGAGCAGNGTPDHRTAPSAPEAKTRRRTVRPTRPQATGPDPARTAPHPPASPVPLPRGPGLGALVVRGIIPAPAPHTPRARLPAAHRVPPDVRRPGEQVERLPAARAGFLARHRAVAGAATAGLRSPHVSHRHYRRPRQGRAPGRPAARGRRPRGHLRHPQPRAGRRRRRHRGLPPGGRQSRFRWLVG